MKKSFDYADLVKSNPSRSISGFDYLRAVYKGEGLTGDFLVWMSRLFLPEFKVIDGHLFVLDLFDEKRFHEMRAEGKSLSEIQHWFNLLEITGLFDEITACQARELAEAIASTWNYKIQRDFGNDQLSAIVVSDAPNELFVAIR